MQLEEVKEIIAKYKQPRFTPYEMRRAIHRYYMENNHKSLLEIGKEIGLSEARMSLIVTGFLITTKVKKPVTGFIARQNDITEIEMESPNYLGFTYDEVKDEMPEIRKLDEFEIAQILRNQITEKQKRKYSNKISLKNKTRVPLFCTFVKPKSKYIKDNEKFKTYLSKL